MALLAKNGYGQVEPNRLNAQRTGRIIADVPVSVDAFEAANEVIQNGMFLTYNPAGNIETNLKKGTMELPEVGGSALTGLVMNEIKLYHDSQGNKDFALTTNKHTLLSGVNQSPYRDAAEVAHNTVVPRVFFLEVGDVYTTNLVDVAEPALGDILTPGAEGILVADSASAGALQLQVVQLTTLPDGQKAVKLAVIKA